MQCTDEPTTTSPEGLTMAENKKIMDPDNSGVASRLLVS
jgi:hypothetical protein